MNPNVLRPARARSVRSLGGPYSVLSTGTITSFAPSYLPGNHAPSEWLSSVAASRAAPSDAPLTEPRPSDVGSESARTMASEFTATASTGRGSMRAEKGKPPSGSVVAAVFEDRSKREVGIAVLDGESMRINLHQFEDLNSFMITVSSLKRYDPVTILLPAVTGSDNPCHRAIQEQCKGDILGGIEEISRKYFDDCAGEAIFLQSLGSLKDEVVKRRCCLAALAAVIRYTEVQYELLLKRGLLSISFNPIDDCMLINRNAVENLELFDSRIKANGFTLASQFHTSSSSGARILRNAIRFPLTSREEVDMRLDIVEYLIEQPSISTLIQSYLVRLADIDQLISRFLFRSKIRDENFFRRSITAIVRLNGCLNTIKECYTAISRALRTTEITTDAGGAEGRKARGRAGLVRLVAQLDEPSLVEILTAFEASSILLEEPPAQSRMSRAESNQVQLLSLLRPGANSYLDAARSRFIGHYQDMLAYVDHLKEERPDIGLHLEFSDARGYHLWTKARHGLEACQRDFVWVKQRGQKVTFSTLPLQSLNNTLKDLRLEILGIVYEELEELFLATCQNALSLYRVNDVIGMLDFFGALSHFAQVLPYACRPTLGGEVKLKEAFHPLMHQVEAREIVPLTFSLAPFKEGAVITGENGSGKSTLLRTVGVVQVLAQLGSFVPARAATVCLCDHLLARMGGPKDDAEGNLSSFGEEMATCADIVALASDRSLILLDELGMGTSPSEGSALTWAISEEFHRKKSHFLLVTHFRSLPRLTSLYPLLKAFQMGAFTTTRENGTTVRAPTFELRAGSVSDQLPYGIACAEQCGLPDSLVARATALTHVLSKADEKNKRSYQKIEKQALKELAPLELGCRLEAVVARLGNEPPEDQIIWNKLHQFKIREMVKEDT